MGLEFLDNLDEMNLENPIEVLPNVESSFPIANLPELRIIKKDGLRHTFSVTVRVPGTSAATAANYTTLFFTARRNYEIISVKERHETIGSDAGAVTITLYKVPDGTAPASGTDVLTATLSLKATANTLQAGTVSTVVSTRRLIDGDSLTLITSGTLTDVAGVTMVVELKSL